MSEGMDATAAGQARSLDWRELGMRIVRAAYVATTCALCAIENPDQATTTSQELAE